MAIPSGIASAEQQVSQDQPGAMSIPPYPGAPPPQTIPGPGSNPARRGTVTNPAYLQWQQQMNAYNQAIAANRTLQQTQSAVTARQSGGGAGIPPNYVWNGTAWVPPNDPSLRQQQPYGPPIIGGVGGGGGAMTAYEAAQVALDKQKMADAEAQQKADQEYRNAQALDAFNKQWQDFQTKHYYGSIMGPAYAAPAGASSFFKLPEPQYVQDYYKNNPQAGGDPWSQTPQYGGYSGSLFSNPQQPGTQQTPPTGALAAPVAAGQGQSVNGPTPGVTSGALPIYNPAAPQSGQNVLTPPPIAPPKSMARGGMSDGTELAVVHGGEKIVEPFGIGATGISPRPKTIGATGAPVLPKQPVPALVSPSYNPGYPIPGMADGGKVPGPPGQPQLAVLHAGEDVVPGGNFSDNNPSPVANAGPESMNPLIKQLLSAVNGIITSPEFQSAVYSSDSGMTKPPIGGGDDTSTPGSFASGWPPDPGTYDPNIYRPGSVPGTWMDVATGRPVTSPTLPTTPFTTPVFSSPVGSTTTPTTPTPPPIARPTTTPNISGIVPGPTAVNHVPYGPELTGMSGYGGLITPNGTPVVASEWQRQHLDPTSLGNYEDYAGSIAGYNPADLKQLSDTMTGVLNENSPTIKAPIRFNLSGQTPVPGQGGG